MSTSFPPRNVSPYEMTSPFAAPSQDTLSAFWRKISYLTTRTRTRDGRWVGSQEVKAWNSRNTLTCDKCAASRNLKQCYLAEDDQPSCRPCRDGKTACDRKFKFLFDSTCEDFFPSFDMFISVYNARDKKLVRTFQKTANKRRRSQIPYSVAPERRVVLERPPAILLRSTDEENRDSENINVLKQMETIQTAIQALLPQAETKSDLIRQLERMEKTLEHKLEARVISHSLRYFNQTHTYFQPLYHQHHRGTSDTR
ncbi:hypothetical protein B0H17DRAFT_141755 [Mycena rosella]|uniref:Uncharacterized protein n=1 Tax=Mycena rosella TaxID=1033263 RepID=A0AAD7DXW9_MYCRO|nr:hypothetical protein B0H17DRAFT_141755 [Mycena rosella]